MTGKQTKAHLTATISKELDEGLEAYRQSHRQEKPMPKSEVVELAIRGFLERNK